MEMEQGNLINAVNPLMEGEQGGNLINADQQQLPQGPQQPDYVPIGIPDDNINHGVEEEEENGGVNQPPPPQQQPIVNIPGAGGVDPNEDTVNPETSRIYFWWTFSMFVLASLSAIVHPLLYGFFTDFPEISIRIIGSIDVIISAAFILDFVFPFYVSYRDSQTGCIVKEPRKIAWRYLNTYFIFNLLSIICWDISGSQQRSVNISYLSWITVARVAKVIKFLHIMQDDRRINKKFSRVVKVVMIVLLYAHISACFFYFLATTVPLDQEGHTWIGSLKIGSYSYSEFRNIDFAKRYLTSLYFVTVTLTTVGFGDIHAVGAREMIFIIVFVSLNLYVGTYLSSNISALLDIRSNGQVSDHRTYEHRTSHYRSGSDNTHARICTVFHHVPINIMENRIQGHTMWIPRTMGELIEKAARRANLVHPESYYILSEVGGEVPEVDMIDNGQNLFLVAR